MGKGLFHRALLGALISLCLLLPASASTWRSPSGNIFRFFPDGSMTAYWNGEEHVGYWWWISSNSRFGYSVAGYTCYVTMKGGAAVCRGAGAPQQWTLMSVRGDRDEEEQSDTRSWFISRTDTPTMKPKN
jgi:hypothetical protein